MNVGQTVSLEINGETAFGVVRTEPTLTPSGEVVKVQLLPDFEHLLPTGWTDAGVEDLTAAKVCACAHLAYRPIWGQYEGKLITTGCDFGRSPKGRFLPGHDAKAKGFLIKASGYAQTLTNGLGALEQAREFGDKISMAVAKGIDNARERDHKRTQSRRWRRQVDRDPAPTTREDDLTDAQRLQRELKVTDPMIHVLVSALVKWDGDVVGGPTGTVVALQKRGLVEKGGRGVTALGRQVVDYDLNPENPVCTADEEYHSPGVYPDHWNQWNHDLGYHCRRCGHIDENQ